MSDLFSSFHTAFTVTPDFAGRLSTASSFAFAVNAGFSFGAVTNSLRLSVDSPTSLTFSPDSAGTLTLGTGGP